MTPHPTLPIRGGRNHVVAFTLAEVLITLVVIGIIAAITVPVMMNNYKERETITKVKKFNSTFSNAIKLAIVENGAMQDWDLASKSGNYDSVSATKFANYIKPYLNIMKDCGTKSNSDCVHKGAYKNLNGKDRDNYSSNSSYYKMILSDGSSIWFRTDGNGCRGQYCGYIWLDVNGAKKPNQFGKDTFTTAITINGLKHSLYDNCSYSGSGIGCMAYIINYESMDYPKN